VVRLGAQRQKNGAGKGVQDAVRSEPLKGRGYAVTRGIVTSERAAPGSRRRQAGRPPQGQLDARATLLRAATVEFAQNGYAATNNRDILKAAGVSTPTMYHHFASKADLYITVVRDGVDELLDRMQKAGAGQRTTLAESFDAVLAGINQVYRNRPHLIHLLLDVEAAVRVHPELETLSTVASPLMDFWHSLGGRHLGDAEVLALRGLVEGYIRLGSVSSNRAIYDRAQRVFRAIVVGGLTGLPTGNIDGER
jgi:AcrR family transcriptional regulator